MDDASLAAYLAECRDAGCTPRQLEVLALHAHGETQEQIAEALGIRQQVVARHLARVRRHLARQEDVMVLQHEICHLVEQDIEEVVCRGVDDEEDTVSCWRDATLAHGKSNLGVMKPTRRRRKQPQG
ncbi:MAG TPA: hypothetical protein DCQ64_24170 [Candidatus Rokubacteria bacterium]|nr:hypothetical protein [Candidatus Rokubacteria bacterium]